MKRKIYYLAFTLLGAMIGFMVHVAIEFAYIQLLLENWDKYGFGWSYEVWDNIHTGLVIACVLLFSWIGFGQGVRWWRILYIQKRYLKRWGINLKENF